MNTLNLTICKKALMTIMFNLREWWFIPTDPMCRVITLLLLCFNFLVQLHVFVVYKPETRSPKKRSKSGPPPVDEPTWNVWIQANCEINYINLTGLPKSINHIISHHISNMLFQAQLHWVISPHREKREVCVHVRKVKPGSKRGNQLDLSLGEVEEIRIWWLWTTTSGCFIHISYQII